MHQFENKALDVCLSYVLLFILCGLNPLTSAQANDLTNRWVSCNDNDQSISSATRVRLNGQCYYQELPANAGDSYNFRCEATTSAFSGIELKYSNAAYQQVKSSIDTTTSSTTLSVSLSSAPVGTRYVVAAIYADEQATMSCNLSNGNSSSNPSRPIIGPCLDTDNDGYGWNGVRTCTPATSVTSTAPTIQNTGVGPCIDTDNDGYGWNGVRTCTDIVGQPAGPINNNTPPAASSSAITDLVLVTGQSNAQGAATTVDLAVLDAPNQRVLAYTDAGTWELADLRQHWDGPLQPRHPGKNALVFENNIPHNNFAFHFAKSLATQDRNRVVGIVLVTAPGAGIRSWDKGSNLYRTLSSKAELALNASGKTSFDAVLWHQGETDFLYNGTSDALATSTEKRASNYYPDRLNTLIRNLRQESWFSSTKPVFICGETQKTSTIVAPEAPVNRRLMELNSDNDPYTGCVSADGLATKDGIHFNASSLREIGKRYASRYLQLQR